jgi:hypothetical protein
MLASLLIAASGCAIGPTPADPTESAPAFDERSFWESLPRLDDAVAVEVADGFHLGYATGMIEPELFDLYATWLSDHGWHQQAPTEAMLTLPHQTWHRDGLELLIELHGLDEQGRTIVWLKLEQVP